MTISIIGAGNMAYFMATRLKSAGFHIIDIFARQRSEAEKLAKISHARGVDKIMKMNPAVDVFIFALPDKTITEFTQGFPFKQSLWIHCAGAVSANVFKVENAGVLWPLYSLNKEDLPKDRGIPVFYEGRGEQAQKIMPLLANAVSDNARFANQTQREELHLSAVFVNNFVNHLMAITQQRMEAINLPFNESLQPIIKETIQQAQAGTSAQHQTGPAIRNDQSTLEKHLSLLRQHPEWQTLYKAVSQSIQQFYPENKIQS